MLNERHSRRYDKAILFASSQFSRERCDSRCIHLLCIQIIHIYAAILGYENIHAVGVHKVLAHKKRIEPKDILLSVIVCIET